MLICDGEINIYDAKNNHPLCIICIFFFSYWSSVKRCFKTMAETHLYVEMKWTHWIIMHFKLHKHCVWMIRSKTDLWFCHVKCDISLASSPFNIYVVAAAFRQTLVVASHQYFLQSSEVEFYPRAIRRRRRRRSFVVFLVQNHKPDFRCRLFMWTLKFSVPY